MAVLDVKRAHFYGDARWKVHARLPDEFAQPGTIGTLLKSMYGTIDAAQIWNSTWTEHLLSPGYVTGEGCSAMS